MRKTILKALSLALLLPAFFMSCEADDEPAGLHSDASDSEFHTKVEFAETVNGISYYYFGDWPQTLIADGVTVDESVSLKMGGFTYYKGSDDSWYAKAVYNGNNETNLPSGIKVQPGESKYFKVEPIKWRKLSDSYNGGSLLFAESVLTGGIKFYGSQNNRFFGDDENDWQKYVDPCNYKYSNVRAYLNGIKNQFITDGGNINDENRNYNIDWSGKGFLQSAFTEGAQDLILKTKVDNSEESTYGAYHDYYGRYCADTEDKVFLLCTRDLINPDFGLNYSDSLDDSKAKKTVDYAVMTGTMTREVCYDSGKVEYYAGFMTRSPFPYNLNYVITSVGADGEIGCQDTNSYDCNICPAIVVQLNN